MVFFLSIVILENLSLWAITERHAITLLLISSIAIIRSESFLVRELLILYYSISLMKENKKKE